MEISISLYVVCGFMFMLGQAIHLFWIKFPSFKKNAAASNKPFSYREWWNCDKWLVIGLQLFGISVFMGLDQLLHFKPEVMDYMKWFFWLFGAFGSNIIFQKFSQYSNGQISLMSIKSNTFDALNGLTTNVNDAIEKGTALTGGQDVTQTPEQK